jgi:hypothetical protein
VVKNLNIGYRNKKASDAEAFFVDKGRCFRRTASPKRTSIAGTKNKINNILEFSENFFLLFGIFVDRCSAEV